MQGYISHKNISLIICLALISVTILIYGQVANFDFINLDDNYYVYKNMHIQNGLTLEGIKWAFTNVDVGQYIPMVWLTYMIDIQFCGLSAGWFHLTNLFFHLGNVLLTFYLFQYLSNNVYIGFAVATFLAIHPMHAESVSWVTERKDVLSMFFFLSSLIAYSKYAKTPQLSAYISSFFLFVFGMLSKPMLVTLPLILILLDYWPFNRLANHKKPARQNLCEKAPFFIISIIFGILTMYGTHHTGGVVPLGDISPGFRLSNMMVSYIAYLMKLVYPVNLAVVYPYPEHLSTAAVLISAAAFTAITAIALILIRKKPYVLVGWFWYLIVLVPVIGLTQAGEQSMADRFTYIPFLGIYFIISMGVADLYKSGRVGNFSLAVMAVPIAGLLVLLSYKQVALWENSVTLFRHTAKVTENNRVAYFCLGDALHNEGHFSEAVEWHKKALTLLPSDTETLNHLGLSFLKLGEYDNAVEVFRKAITLNQNQPITLNNIGIAYFKKKEYVHALDFFNNALEARPGYQEAISNRHKTLTILNEQHQEVYTLE